MLFWRKQSIARIPGDTSRCQSREDLYKERSGLEIFIEIWGQPEPGAKHLIKVLRNRHEDSDRMHDGLSCRDTADDILKYGRAKPMRFWGWIAENKQEFDVQEKWGLTGTLLAWKDYASRRGPNGLSGSCLLEKSSAHATSISQNMNQSPSVHVEPASRDTVDRGSDCNRKFIT